MSRHSYQGLTSEEAARSRAEHGSNYIAEVVGRRWLSFWWEALEDRTLRILMVAAAILFLFDFYAGATPVDGIAILLAVLLASGITATNDWRAQSEFKSLQVEKEAMPVRAWRDGELITLSSFDLVVGDRLELGPGDKLPADGFLLDGPGLSLDQSLITGESEAVARLPDDGEMLRAGTMVVEGRGAMKIVAVGEGTEYGRLRTELQVEQEPTPLQVRLGRLADRIGLLGVAAAALIFLTLAGAAALGGQVGMDAAGLRVLLTFLTIAVAMVVAVVPEGLPVAVTISLAYSVMRMARDRSLVRRLVACETMGAANVLCVDKTGTLTENRMKVRRVMLADGTQVGAGEGSPDPGPLLDLFQQVVAVDSTAYLAHHEDGRVSFVGNPTEGAMLELLERWGMDWRGLRESAEVVTSLDFSSDRKRMSTVISHGEGAASHLRVLVKGAPEVILERCTSTMDTGGRRDLDETTRQELAALAEEWAGEAWRVLALAVRDLDGALPQDLETLEDSLCLVGMVAIGDPVRAEVQDAVDACRTAGVDVKMLTGDATATAQAVARRIGLLQPGDRTLDGATLRAMDDEELAAMLPELRVVARAVPSDKLRLVNALRAEGQVVGVTGDGTNDAPALRRADVGLSMGRTGTDLAREASDIVIVDDDFSSVVKAVRWGRTIFGNVRRFLQFQLTVSLVALAVSFLAALTGHGMPLTVVQILWINIIMDTMAALALALGEPDENALKRPPHGRDEPLITPTMWVNIVGTGLVMLAVLLAVMWGGLLVDPASPHRATFIFNAFVFLQLGNLVNCRTTSFHEPALKGIGRARAFLLVFAAIVLVQAGLVEWGGAFFRTSPLPADLWVTSALLGAGVVLLGALFRKVGRTLPDDWPDRLVALSIRALAAGRRAAHAFARWLRRPAREQPLALLAGVGAVAILAGVALRSFAPWSTGPGFGLFAAGLALVGTWLWETRVRFAGTDLGSTRRHAWISLALAALLLVQVQTISARYYHRYDLTSEQLFQLSPQTAQILNSMDGAIHLTMVFRPGNQARDVETLLTEYAAVGRHVYVQSVDPDTDPGEVERLADRLELATIPPSTVVVEYQGRHRLVTSEDMVERVYTYRDGRRLLMRGAPVSFRGEAAITSALTAVVEEEPARICFVQGHQERSPESYDGEGVGLLKDMLRRQAYTVGMVVMTGRLPLGDTCDVLVQPGPRQPFDSTERAVLNSWLENGGRWLLTVEPWQAGGLEPLLAEWGVEVRPMYVVDSENRLAGLGATTVVGSRFQEHPLVSSLQGSSVILPYATSVRRQASSRVLEGTNLVLTSKNGLGITDRRSRVPRFDPSRDRRGELSLATVAAQPVNHYHVDGPKRPTRVVVVGDTDFLTNAHLHRMSNSDFVLNAIDWLASRDELVAIRAKPLGDNRITLSSAAQTSLFWLTLGVVPGMVALLGGAVAWRRRR